MKFVPAAACAAFVLLAGAARGETAGDLARIHRIEQSLVSPVRIVGRPDTPKTIAQLMDEKQVPAVSIAFVDNGRIEWVRAYGQADIAAGRKTTSETLFQAGSISKPVAATGTLTLVQQGRLKLDTPVNDQLRSWKLPDNDFTRARPVTLRNLLTHTGSLTVHGFQGYERDKPYPTVVQLLDGAAPANSDPIRVDGPVGKQWRYSGGGFTIAQLMTSDAAGQDFPSLMRERVFTPFGMTLSTYEQPLPAARLGEAAVGYRAKAVPIAGLRNTYPELAAAGLWTTPSDVARWVIGIQDAYAGRSSTVLDQKTATAMLTPGLGHWGLGVQVNGEGRDMVFAHGGANEGFRNEMFGLPGRRQGVVIMTNSDNGEDVMQPLLHAIAAVYGWPGFETKTITPSAVKPGELKPFAGYYAQGNVVAEARVGAGGVSLDIVLPGGAAYELLPQGGDDFIETSTVSPVKFLRDASGRITGMDFGGEKLERRESR